MFVRQARSQDSRRARPCQPLLAGAGLPKGQWVRGGTKGQWVRDLAGGIREWCGDPTFDGRETGRPVKGGSWGSEPRTCRLATRMGLEPWYVVTTYGFRLAQVLP